MSKKTDSAAVKSPEIEGGADAAVETPPVLPVEDPYAGQGGSYIVDPKTGARTLVERTEHAADAGRANQE